MKTTRFYDIKLTKVILVELGSSAEIEDELVRRKYIQWPRKNSNQGMRGKHHTKDRPIIWWSWMISKRELGGKYRTTDRPVPDANIPHHRQTGTACDSL